MWLKVVVVCDFELGTINQFNGAIVQISKDPPPHSTSLFQPFTKLETEPLVAP